MKALGMRLWIMQKTKRFDERRENRREEEKKSWKERKRD